MTLEKQFLARSAALLPLMESQEVTDVLINGVHSLFVERNGALEAVENPFPDRASLMDFIERLTVPIGKRIDAAQPYLDGRLVDGSRFHIILSPIAVEGPIISIRKRRDPSLSTIQSFGAEEVLSWLRAEVRAGKNVLISGGTGTGKTTLLSRLLDEVPSSQRLLILEETLEISPRHPHVIHLESRPPSPDGTGEVTLRSLLRNALRMRPDRIVLGECRGAEAFDLVQAMNTGHAGSLCTIHANGALDALRRLESLTLLAGLQVPVSTVREWVAANINIVVHLERQGPVRRIKEALTVAGLEGEVYRITPKLRPCNGRESMPN